MADLLLLSLNKPVNLYFKNPNILDYGTITVNTNMARIDSYNPQNNALWG